LRLGRYSLASPRPSCPQRERGRACRGSHCACQNRLPPGERSWPAPTFFPLNQTQLPPGPPGTPSTHPAPTKPAPCLGLHLTLTTTSLRPLLLHPSSSPHLTAPHLPPSPPARRTATSTSCGLLARPAASCHFYERDGLRRPLDNGCSLMRSRNGRIEVVKTAPTLPTIFVTTLL
jgi:hypothetical protein